MFGLILFSDFTEEVKLAQLADLNKQLEGARDQEQFGNTDWETQGAEFLLQGCKKISAFKNDSGKAEELNHSNLKILLKSA